jgi:hypothetical protein
MKNINCLILFNIVVGERLKRSPRFGKTERWIIR